jgi:hypothetical protein
MFQVVEIYSEYINNFSRAMELVRLEAKRRILMRLTLYVSGGGDLLWVYQQLQPRHGTGAAGEFSWGWPFKMFQVVEIYSEYINNFSRAMELVRLEAKRRILMRLTL